ncbi:MAG TPA: gfo/Idh/MocA family oxidoreductase [Porphyromonadaceae bacterium]|jgi:predicted dehydrogenase|nr:gfo/Idh/MocA family oxidoreductase [Porphyromonadaceae bacterium]HBX18962.1 gfo/Idh/MocA family oxidoreductase [Porphyromonadaceae bacterium]
MKVLIIGLGSIAKKHLFALRQIDSSVEIVAFRSSLDASIEDGVKNVYNWDDIKKELPDFIILSNPTYLHAETIGRIIDCGVPIFIEKPVFASIGEEKEKLIQKITEQGIITYVACNLRFLHALQKIKEIIKSERVNEVNVYCGSYLPDWRPNVDFRKVYSANKEMGGGVHLDLIHELDYVYWIFGNPIETNAVLRNNSSLNIQACDYANYTWAYNDFCVSVILNYYRRTPKRSMEIVCDSGIYYVDLLKNNIVYNEHEIFSSDQQIKDTYKEQLAFFLDYILKGKNVFNSIEEAYKILCLCY